jgi:hypothetical protein
MRCNCMCADEKRKIVFGRQRKKRPKSGEGLAVVVVEDRIVKGPVVNEAAPEGVHYVIIPTPNNCLRRRGRRGLAATATLLCPRCFSYFP